MNPRPLLLVGELRTRGAQRALGPFLVVPGPVDERAIGLG